MLDTTLWEDIDTFVEMLHSIDEMTDEDSKEVVRYIAEALEVELDEKPPHPIMKRNPKNLFPDYEKMATIATAWLEEGLNIYGAPEAKRRLMIYLQDSKAYGKDIRAGREKTTVNEKVYLELVVLADKYLEIPDAQNQVEKRLGLKQSNVSRSFKRLEQVKLIERFGFSPETGIQTWRLCTPAESLRSGEEKR